MELYQRQQFDFLLHTAVERYVERIEQRNEGAGKALEKIQADREAPGIWMSQFVDAIFEDFLVNNLEGACFVLRALASRPAPAMDGAARNVEQMLIAASKQVFADLFYRKVTETLEQHAAFEAAGA